MFRWMFCLAALSPGSLSASDFDIVFSELHYNPFGSGEPDLEFVELHNAGSASVDLSGWSFGEGLDFTFPAGSFLEPDGYLALAADADALRSAHPGANVIGDYSGHLDNSGELLRLVNARGQRITQVHFRDGKGWPGRPDGKGPSLELLVFGVDIDRPQVWAPSRHFGGTPGAPNTRVPEEYPYTGEESPFAVRLNEVKPPSAGDAEGFIELFNSSPNAVDVSGFRLLVSNGASAAVPGGSVVPAGQPLVIRGGQLGIQLTSEEANYALLQRDGETFADALESPIIPAAASTGRIPDGKGDGFVLAPTRGQPNAFTQESRVVFHEIFFASRFEQPSGKCFEDCADRHQWLEIHNRSGSSVDLSGWKLDRGVDFDFPPGTEIGSNGFLIIVASQATFQTDHPGISAVPGEWKGSLGSREDTLVLRDATGNVADRIHYGNGKPYNEGANGRDDRTITTSDWPRDVSDSGRSIELAHPLLDSSAGRSWRLGPVGGTPKAQNSTFENDPLPVIADVSHFPAVPDSRTGVRVTCKAHAVGGVQAVEIVWHVDGQVATSSVLMQEDTPGGSTYSGELLPQPNRTIVGFQLVVTSLSGRTDTYPPRPGTGGRTPFYLYEVDNDGALPNGHSIYRVILSKADVDALKSRPLQSDALLNCTFIGDGEVHHMAALRYRGENSRGNERKSYRIELPPEDSFQGIEKLNLNAAYGGTPPTSSVRDFLSADLFRRAGLPYPVEWPVNLYFTRGVSGDLQGNANVDPFYVHKENFDRDFLSRYFSGSDGGNFYRPRDPGGGSGDLSYRGEDPSSYVNLYEKKSNSDADDYSDVIELTRAFDRNETPDAVFEQEMRRLVDVKEWAAFFAIQDYLTNIDGGIQTISGEDYFLYHMPDDSSEPNAGQWVILPWDIEETFDNASAGFFITDIAAARRFIRHPAFAPLYLAKLREIALGVGSLAESRPHYQYVRETFPDASVGGILGFFDNYFNRRATLAQDSVFSGIEVAAATNAPQGDKLISEGDTWAYFKGTREPSGGLLDWAFPGFDDGAWSRGPSGFGYGDNDDQTVFDDMAQFGGNPGYLSAYARKTFQIASPDALTSLSLVVDYDDAFVAYLNGFEVARSPNLASAGPSDEPIPFNLELGDAVNHEASRGGNGANPPETFPIADFRSILKAGSNVLAIHGFNSTRDSRDFSLIPELVAVSGAAASGGAGWGTEIFVSGDTAKLQGIATGAAGSVRAGGVTATVDKRPPGGGTPFSITWKVSVPVQLGANRVRIEAFTGLNADGELVEAREIVVHRIDRTLKPLDGVLAGETTLTPEEGPYLVNSGVRVAAGARLVLRPGTELLVGSGASITVEGSLDAAGDESSPIHIRPASLAGRWSGITFSRTGTSDAALVHRLSHVIVELAGAPSGATGAIAVRGARLLVEDCSFDQLSQAAIDARDSRIEVHRSTFANAKGGVLCQATRAVIADCTFSSMQGGGDAIELRGNLDEPSLVERCEIEGGQGDGIVLIGATSQVRFNTVRRVPGAACLVNGVGPLGPSTVEGNTFTDSGTGLELRGAGLVADVGHSTIVWCDVGLLCSGDAQGGAPARADVHSMILWRSRSDVVIGSKFQLTLEWSDVEDSGPWVDGSDLSTDPGFAAPNLGDFSLAPDSPCRGAGRDGADMGATGASVASPVFLRGDVTEDGGVNLTDGIVILNHLFRGSGPLACDDAGDIDDNGTVNVTDVISLLNFLFRGGPTVAAPYPTAGADPTQDDLACR